MKGLLLALAMAGLSATAYGATALSDRQVDRTAARVKRMERADKFKLRERMGGAFKLSATYCEPREHLRVVCQWDALAALTTDGQPGFGERWGCSVELRMHGTASRSVYWKRVVTACAKQRVDAP